MNNKFLVCGGPPALVPAQEKLKIANKIGEVRVTARNVWKVKYKQMEI